MSVLKKQQVLDLLQDNNTKQISASDVREIVDYTNVYGGMVASQSGIGFMQEPDEDEIIKINQWEFPIESNGVTPNPTGVASSLSGTLSIDVDGIYQVFAELSFEGSPNTLWKINLFKNGANLNPSIGTETKLDTGIDVISSSFMTFATFASGDLLSLHTQHDKTVTKEFTLRNSQFVVRRIE